jgi:hypothetical protein
MRRAPSNSVPVAGRGRCCARASGGGGVVLALVAVEAVGNNRPYRASALDAWIETKLKSGCQPCRIETQF